MNLTIRTEEKIDHAAVHQVVQRAFAAEEMSDQSEHLLVQRIRASDAFVPELSLVAELDGKIVGHILLSKVNIQSETDSFPSLALAPVSVLPDFQNIGLGSKLIQTAHIRAKALDYNSIVLIGHADYYPRFGYLRAMEYQVEFPFDAPLPNCMILEVSEGSLDGVSGIVEYSPPFLME